MRVGGSKVTLQGFLDPQSLDLKLVPAGPVGLKVERRKVKSHYLRQGGSLRGGCSGYK